MCSAVIDKATGMPLPTRKSVRQMRWFERSFRARMAATSAQIGVQFELSDRRLADAFLSWHRAFDSQKPASRMVRRSYVGFAAGMMFHELLSKRPVTIHQVPAQDDQYRPALIWPEEYLYASYCHSIRQAILGQDFWLDTRKHDRLDDPALWEEFMDGGAIDREAAIEFLGQIANEPLSSQHNVTTNTGSSFGKRLWKLAERHTASDLPEDSASAGSARTGFGLRLVSDKSPLSQTFLPASTRLVLVAFEGVAAQTAWIDTQELCILLSEYNAELTPEQTHDLFFGQPVSAAMTYVAERTGQLCPGSFVSKLDQRLTTRDKHDLVPMPGIQELFQRLGERGIDFGIVSHGSRLRVEAAGNLPAMSGLKSAGPVHMLTPDNGLATVANTYGHSPRDAILIDASSTGIGMAQSVSMPAYGFVPQARPGDRNALRFAGAQVILANLETLV